MPRTIIEVASINQLKRERDPLAGRKELIKERVQLKEGAAVRFSIRDRQERAAALHALSGASGFRGIAQASQLCKAPRQFVFMGALLQFILVQGCSS